MTLLLLAYLGGVLTILSPCVLPVLPFVFARADRPFLRNGLPMLVGMAATFALVATLASVAGGWAVKANTAGRYVALALMALFAITLLFPSLADRLTRPLVALGGRLTERADEDGKGGLVPSLLLGVATGLLWAPCAGPILGIILTGAALQGASVGTTVLLAVYAAGAATSLALALVIGGKVFTAMKKSLHASEWVRKGLGALILVAVAVIALGLDTGFLTRVSAGGTTKLEQGLLAKLNMKAPAAPTGDPATLVPMPPLTGATAWINSPPLTPESLRGKVVVVDFWTYSCINCLRALPYVKSWAQTYGPQGLVVIGVHTPEFAFEKNEANVRKAIKDLGLPYPVAMDNDFAVWKAFKNTSWPTHYFIDTKGRIRHVHVGEGEYDKSEQMIRTLLAERNGRAITGPLAGSAGAGAQAAAGGLPTSPETYLGYNRAEGFVSPQDVKHDETGVYTRPADLPLNAWALAGKWKIGMESADNQAAGDRIVFRFQARDLHMVLGPVTVGKNVRFRVKIDGKAPGDQHGIDTDAAGNGLVTTQRLYQLIRQKSGDVDHVFEIEFLDPGAQAFTFTFG